MLLMSGCGFSAAQATDGGGGIDAGGSDTVDAALLDVPPTGLPSPRKLVFANTASPSNLDDFPVLVAPTPATIDYAVVTNPMTELRFTDAGGGDLKFEIEYWNPGGESIVWVEVPRIDASSDADHIFMHFGPGEVGTHDAAAVWGDYELVTHLGGSLQDRSNHGHDATLVNTLASGGYLGGATMFSGLGDQRITFDSSTGLFDGWTRFALELWIRPEYANIAAINGEPRVLDKGDSLNGGRLFPTFAVPPAIVMQVDLHLTSNNDVYLNAPTPPDAWTHILYTYDGDAVRLYRNGTQQGMASVSNKQLVPGTLPFFLGAASNGFRGLIDEVRISRVARSADWVRAQHLSMTRQFVTFTDP